MSKQAFAPFVLAALVSATGCAPQDEGISAASQVEEIPISTSSSEALEYFMLGQEAADFGRGVDANQAFRKAVEADPGFARGYLNLANSSFSAQEFFEYSDKAMEVAGDASEGERLLIEINLTFRNNDADRRLVLSKQLVEEYPSSPRAWATLAGTYSGLDRNEDARRALEEALVLDPNSVVAFSAMGFSYLFTEPKDFNKATLYFETVVEIAPSEAAPQVNLGDAYRANQDLGAARDAYTRATEVDATNGVAWVKKGHVNSFLANFDEARSDYARAVEIAKPQNKSNYSNYGTFTYVHEGNPEAAVRELWRIVETVEEVGTPAEQVNGSKIFALTNMATIAMHHAMFDQAQAAISERNALVMENAMKIGSEDFIRGQRAQVAYWTGQLAARMGKFERAKELAAENQRLLEPDNNPRKLEPYHNLMGLTALLEEEHEEAIGHYAHANLNNMYTRYHLGLALEGAGHLAEAQEIFKLVYGWNFNSVGYALVRKDAKQRMIERVSIVD